MTRRLVSDERGVALVLAIVTMMVLGSLTAALLLSVAVNQRSASTSSESEKAFALAEEGIAYAEGRLYTAPSANLVDGDTLPETNLGAGWNYAGTYTAGTQTWTLTGQGTYDGVSRTVVVQVPLVTQTQTLTTSESAVYDYLFANSSSSCVSFSGNAVVTVPLYTNGCLNLNDHVAFNGNELEVGNYLNLGPNATVGSSSNRIGILNVVHGCEKNGAPISCGTGNASPIWAKSIGTALSPPNLTLPTITLQEQSPTCGPGSTGVPGGYFDTDSALNNPTRPLASILFPSTAYDCKIDANDEIKWDGSEFLTVTGGPYYFDGSLSLAGTTQIVYSGSAAIFFTGTVTLAGQASICGISSAQTTTSKGKTTTTYCSNQWDPAGARSGGVTNQLVFAVGCWAAGSTVASPIYVTYAGSGSYCVDLSGQNTLQVGTVLNEDFHSGGQATDMGPVAANTLTIAGNPGQLLPFSTLPAGAPSTTTTPTSQTVAGPPKTWSG